MIRDEKKEREDRNFQMFEDMMNQNVNAMPPPPPCDLLPPPVPEINPFSGEAIIEVQDSQVVKEAREERWGKVVGDAVSPSAKEESVKLPSEDLRDPSLSILPPPLPPMDDILITAELPTPPTLPAPPTESALLKATECVVVPIGVPALVKSLDEGLDLDPARTKLLQDCADIGKSSPV